VELVVSFTPPPLYPYRKKYPVSTEYEAGWVPEPVAAFWGREEFHTVAGNRTT